MARSWEASQRKRQGSPVAVDYLEPRIFASANEPQPADLAVSSVSGVPDVVLAGDREAATVRITNNGLSAANGVVRVTLFLSLGPTPANGNPALASQARRLRIGGKRKIDLRVRF